MIFLGLGPGLMIACSNGVLGFLLQMACLVSCCKWRAWSPVANGVLDLNSCSSSGLYLFAP